MKNVKAKVAAGATVIALGGLTGLALSQGGKAPGAPVADKPIVHTKVIRRTVHVTKHAQPKHPPAAAPVEPAGTASTASAPVTTGSSGAAEGSEPTPVSTGSSSAGTETEAVTTGSSGTGAEPAPVSTGSSGGGGGGGEVEHESEGGGGGGADD